jgi:hypothetical protein
VPQQLPTPSHEIIDPHPQRLGDLHHHADLGSYRPLSILVRYSRLMPAFAASAAWVIPLCSRTSRTQVAILFTGNGLVGLSDAFARVLGA